MTFSENLKKIRKEKGFSQKDIANKLGVSQPSYAQYENDKRKPKLETVRRIAETLGVSINELQPDWTSFALEEIKNDFELSMVDHQRINRLVSYFDKLSPKGQDTIIEQAKSLMIHPDLLEDSEILSSEDSTFKPPIVIQTIAAHFDGSEYTEEELEEIKKFAEFVKSKRKDQK